MTSTQMISLFVESTVPSKRKKIKLSEWPVKSFNHCYYCCHTFRSVPIPMVHNEFEFDKLVFHICVDDTQSDPSSVVHPYPVFCSVNCLIGHIGNSNLNKVVLIHNAKMIQHFWSRFFQFEEKECSLQTKPRYLLNMFGGAAKGSPCHDGHSVCNITEFRQGSCRFVDKRPNQETSQTIGTGEHTRAEKDLIYWPNMYPHLEAISVPTHVPGLTVPLTLMEDPSEAMLPITSSVQEEKTDNRTVTMVSEILQQTLDTKKLQEVSDALSGMSLIPTPATPPPPPSRLQHLKSASKDSKSPPPNHKQNKTPKQDPKRRKLKINSPPTKYPPPSQMSYSEHPLFARRTKF